MLRSGDLKHRVTIKRPGVPTKTAGGGSTPGALITVASDIPARVRDLSGDELQRAMQTTTKATVEVRMRYRDDLTSVMNIVDHRGRTLQLAGPPSDPDGQMRELYILCRIV